MTDGMLVRCSGVLVGPPKGARCARYVSTQRPKEPAYCAQHRSQRPASAIVHTSRGIAYGVHPTTGHSQRWAVCTCGWDGPYRRFALRAELDFDDHVRRES